MGHVWFGLALFVIGEILKLVLVERLFAVSRHKLLSIPAFKWTYRHYRQVMNRIEATKVWQAVQRWCKIAQYAVRSYLLEIKNSHSPARVSFQSR
jgi:hypothetical protein